MDSIYQRTRDQKEKSHENYKVQESGLAILALAALSILVVPIAKAQCGAAHSSGGLSPSLKSLQEQALQGHENNALQALPPESQAEARSSSSASILGLWKMVLFARAELNDVGFEQFGAGGTELVNDAGPFNAGNNFCIGAWKQVGPRSYDIVHSFFLFDGNNAIGVSIERAHFLVSQDGNRFTGTWTQDNYDLYGTLIPKTILMARWSARELHLISNILSLSHSDTGCGN